VSDPPRAPVRLPARARPGRPPRSRWQPAWPSGKRSTAANRRAVIALLPRPDLSPWTATRTTMHLHYLPLGLSLAACHTGGTGFDSVPADTGPDFEESEVAGGLVRLPAGSFTMGSPAMVLVSAIRPQRRPRPPFVGGGGMPSPAPLTLPLPRALLARRGAWSRPGKSPLVQSRFLGDWPNPGS
jgi:hypothetical protein